MGPKLAAALVAAQSDLRAIAKDSTNPHFKNKYASLDAIIAEVRPTLAKHGIAVVQGAQGEHDGKGLTVATTLVHESGEEFWTGVYVPLAKQDPQGAGGALTYGRRYGLSAALCLATDDDDDGNAASRPSAAKRQPAPKAEPKAEAKDNGSPVASHPVAPKWLGLAADRPMPFGNTKGKTLAEHSTKALKSWEDWCAKHEGMESLLKDIKTVLSDRALGEAHESIAAEDAALPFK